MHGDALQVEFTKAGLKSPTLIRLDVENKLSDNLRMQHILARRSEKPGVLLYMLEVVRRARSSGLMALAEADRNQQADGDFLLDKAHGGVPARAAAALRHRQRGRVRQSGSDRCDACYCRPAAH